MENGHYFIFQQTKLFYRVYGQGRKNMLAFHGFGQDSTYYEALSQEMEEYTIYAFDLFFHGESRWPDENMTLMSSFWSTLIGKFLRKNDIDNFSLVGFSLGGKFVLSTITSFPHQIEEVFFIAPDGIKINFWYGLATYPHFIRRYFKSFMSKPGRFFVLLSLVRKLGLMNKGLANFAHKQMDTLEKRRRVYYSWVVFRHLTADIDSVAEAINSNEIKTYMFLGRHDKIITEKKMQKLLNKLKTFELHVLEAGHNFLINDVSNFLKQQKSGKVI